MPVLTSTAALFAAWLGSEATGDVLKDAVKGGVISAAGKGISNIRENQALIKDFCAFLETKSIQIDDKNLYDTLKSYCKKGQALEDISKVLFQSGEDRAGAFRSMTQKLQSFGAEAGLAETLAVGWCSIVLNHCQVKIPEESLLLAAQTASKVMEHSDRNRRELEEFIRQLVDELKSLLAMPDVTSTIASTNFLYAKAFEKVMFLHDEEKDPDVTLAKLYVKPRYKENDHVYPNLTQRLESFIRAKNEHFLLIEGNAGNGKTTLVEWLNYHSQAGTPEVRRLLNGRSMVTVRLRDLKRETLSEGLYDAVWKYLYPNTDVDAEKYAVLLKSSLLVLDGFDELCTIDKVAGYDKLLRRFSERLGNVRLPVKVVVTSRPNYIGALSGRWEQVTLLPFNKAQREEWLSHYTNKCKRKVAPHIEAHIRSLPDEETGVFDIPLTLYMVVAKELDLDALKNEWLLYHTIFYMDVRKREYDRVVEHDAAIHPAGEHWELYYRINEEIAYRMHQTGNSQLYVEADEVREIIDGLSKTDKTLDKPEIREIVQRCHALCGFWKIRTEDGYLEFYHNDIRDFFLCEKLCREVNALYHAAEWNDAENAVKLVELLQYAEIEGKVRSFIEQRSICERDGIPKFQAMDVDSIRRRNRSDRDFPAEERTVHHFPAMLQRLMTNGGLLLQAETKREGCGGIHSKRPFIGMETATANFLAVYAAAVVPFLKDQEKLPIVEDMWAINANNTLGRLIRMSLCRWYLPCANLRGAELRGAYLCRAYLRFANLRGADLRGADLRGADLRGADLCRAYLCRAYLCRADLCRADLRGADLRGADLSDADLRGADLSDADLTGADLRDAFLPNGFHSLLQKIQVKHLKALNIEGLKIE